MSLIEKVDVILFSFQVADVSIDDSKHVVYDPGGTIDLHKAAVTIADTDGLVGEYVALWSGPREAVSQTIALAPHLIGRDPMMRESIFDLCKRVHRKSDHIGYGLLDVALWDMAGKRVGQPIWALLGGYRQSLPAYASTMLGDQNGGLDSPEAYSQFAEQCYEYGYRAFKMHGPNGVTARTYAAYVERLGETVGGRMDLMLDPASELSTFADALMVGRACDAAGFYWYEDPMSDTSVSQYAHRKLRQMLATPLLITEHVRGFEPKADFLMSEATDFLRADPELDMGITGAMKIARLAEGFGIDVEYHAPGPAQRHCMAATRNSNYYELALVHPVLGNPLLAPVYACEYSDALDAVRADGTFPVPLNPGLGVSYDWDYIRSHETNRWSFV